MFPSFQQKQLFSALTHSYYCYRIPALVRTVKGTLIAFCEARQHTCYDWTHSAIMARRCEDPLQHFNDWEDPFIVKESKIMVAPRNEIETLIAQKLAEAYHWDQEEGYTPRVPTVTNNPAPIVDQEIGVIHLIYCEDYHEVYYTHSSDDGKTWIKSVNITPVLESLKTTYDWTVIASGPGQGIQIRSGDHKGRLIVPFWMASNPQDVTAHQPSQVATLYSDDHGASWQAGEFVPFTIKDPNESKLIQLEDGCVLILSRSNQPLDEENPRFTKAYSISPDGISQWQEYQFDETLPEPRCMGSLGRFGSTLLYSSPDPTAIGAAFNERRNLTLWQSQDEGRSWKNVKRILPGEAAYSDLAVDPSNGWIYLLFECEYVDAEFGRAGGMKIIKFNVEWLNED
jgi:sialidase-1